MPRRCRHTTTQAFAYGGFASPVRKDPGAQLKYYLDSIATPCRFCAALPLLRNSAGSILSDAWNARNGAHYAIHCCPRRHAALGSWKRIVRKDPGPPAETAHHQIIQRGDTYHAAFSLQHRPIFEMETI